MSPPAVQMVPVFPSSFLLPHLAPWLITCLLHQAMTGLVFAQFCIYVSRFGCSDPWYTRLFVGLFVVLNLLDDLKIYAIAMQTFVVNFGHYSEVLKVTWLARSETVVVGALEMLVQCFLALRGFKNLRGWKAVVFGLVSVPLIIASFACSVVTGLKLPPTFLTLEDIRPLVILWGSLTIATDCVISGSLIFHLGGQMSSDITVQTQSLLARLIQITFFCQLPGTITSAVAMALAVQFPSHTYYMPAVAIKSKLASVSFFYVLNCRTGLRRLLPTPATMASFRDSNSEQVSSPKSTAFTSFSQPSTPRSRQFKDAPTLAQLLPVDAEKTSDVDEH